MKKLLSRKAGAGRKGGTKRSLETGTIHFKQDQFLVSWAPTESGMPKQELCAHALHDEQLSLTQVGCAVAMKQIKQDTTVAVRIMASLLTMRCRKQF